MLLGIYFGTSMSRAPQNMKKNSVFGKNGYLYLWVRGDFGRSDGGQMTCTVTLWQLNRMRTGFLISQEGTDYYLEAGLTKMTGKRILNCSSYFRSHSSSPSKVRSTFAWLFFPDCWIANIHSITRRGWEMSVQETEFPMPQSIFDCQIYCKQYEGKSSNWAIFKTLKNQNY